MSKTNAKPGIPAEDAVTRDELNAVANGLGMLMAITSGAVVAAPDGGLQFADTAQGRALKSTLCPQQSGLLIGDRIIPNG